MTQRYGCGNFLIAAAFLIARFSGGETLNVKKENIQSGRSYDARLLFKQEAQFAKLHKQDTDEELIEYLQKCAEKLGRPPNKKDVVGYGYIKSRLGPWHRILERAGLKPKSEKRLLKEQRGGRRDEKGKQYIKNKEYNK